jgi:heme/copper-type cytochrome/quinol oxidase subunit 1
VLFVSVVAIALLALRTCAGKGLAVDGDPWDAQTLEWTTSSPPPAGNFAEWVGEVASPEPLLDRKPDQAERASA